MLSKNIKLLILLCAYVLTIIIFSWVYYSLDDHFYHSYVKYEETTEEMNFSLKVDLTNHIRKNIVANNGLDNGYVYLGEYNIPDEDTLETMFSFGVPKYEYLVIDSLYVTSVEGTKDNMEIGISYHTESFIYEDDEPIGGVTSFKHSTLKQTSNYSVTMYDGSINYAMLFTESYNSPGSDENVVGELITSPNGERKYELWIPHDLSTDLESYFNTLDGFPNQVEGSYYRMLYLSMVTITTLGFGDIVPLTTTSRLLVGLEAVVGMLTIGLAINFASSQGKSSNATRVDSNSKEKEEV